MGAIAAIKKLTGAKVMVDEKDAGVMADGGSSNYVQGGYDVMYESVRADRLLGDENSISLGGTHLVTLHHLGHTKGSAVFY